MGARVFLTPGLEEHSVWMYDHRAGKIEELVNSSARLTQGKSEHCDLSGSRFHVQDGPGGGNLRVLRSSGRPELEVRFANSNVFSWLPAGQGQDAVIHRPDLKLQLSYQGREVSGYGYAKRYYGEYGPHWGYRFIQSSWLQEHKFLWTADATFRLGDGEAKYNYFKLLDGKSRQLVQAKSTDTYQQDSAAYADIEGGKYVARITPLDEWMHDYQAGGTNSRMQLRYCRLELEQPDGRLLEGFALNERCFGVLG